MNYKKTILILCLFFFFWTGRNAYAQSDTFHYISDTTQFWTVPGCVTQVTVQLWGGGGGSGNMYGSNSSLGFLAGGPGAYYEGVISGLTPGQVLTLSVPSGGQWGSAGKYIYYSGTGGTGGWPGGGSGGWAGYDYSYGGGGGGYAAIAINGTYYVVAGAGGGGGGYFAYNCWGGYGGATSGDAGGYDVGPPAMGGTLIAGGAKGGYIIYNCGISSGSFLQGGRGDGTPNCDYEYGGGGGGGGYYGGGGGGDLLDGGGGGSSYPGSTIVANGITFTPITNSHGNDGSASSNYPAPSAPFPTIGFGGYHANGGKGLIIITYTGGFPLMTSTISDSNPVCGLCNGSITVTPSGGATPYTYSWAPTGQTTQTATGLCANTYTLTLTDSCGDVSTSQVVLTSISIVVTASVTANEKCGGDCIGVAKAGVKLGTSPYTYSWAPGGQTTQTATGLCAGIYTVTVTDLNGCSGSASATITQPLAITLTQWTNNVICSGGLDSATVTAAGGVLPYTYLWTPSGKTTATVTGLSTGAYNVKVTDISGCTETIAVNILHPPLLTATMGLPNNVPCYGGIGSVTVTAGGGISPYIYAWTPAGGSTATATGLSAGAYSVTITDRNGCTASSSVTITQPIELTASTNIVTEPLCNGETGSAAVIAAGGTSVYTYLWNPSAQTTATATGLSAGNYNVKVTDMHGCIATANVIITQPAILTATISATNHVPCNGGVGNATITAGGGTLPYTYLWNPTAQTTAKATGLSAGTYNITVKDNNGCTATNTVTITQPPILTATMGIPNRILCNGGTGSVTVTASGGTIPYAYLWTPSAETNANATGLYVGSYTVTITDNHQCTAVATVTMTQPTVLTAKVISTGNIGCTNGNNGTATTQGGGGISPYTYLWKPSNQTNAIATSLFAGSYTVTITDNNGCSATAIATLSQPAQVTATISEPKVICKDSTGILIANPGGGTAPYKYAWSSGATSGIVTITPIATNNYSVIVTDVNGCTATAGIALQYGPAFAVEISGKNAVCVGDSTIICANAIGAIDGVTYQWEPENNTNECLHVSPGLASVYTVIVVDGCGSTTTANATVYTEPSPTVNMGVNFSRGCVPFCVQFLNGSSISKGKIAQYVWNFGDGDSTHSQQPVYCYKSIGEYDVTLTVISDSGCSATLKRNSMVMVYGPPKAEFTYSPQSTTIENPKIQFTNKSTDEYGIAYQWWTFGDNSDSASNEQNPIHTYRDTGTYCATLVVMNNGGCMDTITNCLIIEPAFKLYIPSAFTPNGDGKDEVFQPVGQYVKSFEMYIFDRWGMEIFHSANINQGWNGTVNGGSTISQEDVYVYKITVMDSEDTQHSYVGKVTLLK